MQIYLVGGAVRDELLGLPIQERDWVVVGASPAEMIKQGFLPVGKSFPVFLHPQTKEEYALARTEKKVAGGYHGFTFDTAANVTLEEDLQRRDITINAMAKTTEGKIIDPYGGQRDLENKVLRHVSNAFLEDPVRVLRIARFAARFAHLGFTVASETMTLMQTMVHNGELDFLIAERVWKETERALKEKHPEVFIQVLRQCGALKVLFPEIDALYGVPQNVKYHPEVDTGVHMEMVLAQATLLTPDADVRFAAMLHDLGKGQTPPAQWPEHDAHEMRSAALVKELCSRLRVPNDFAGLAYAVAKYHGECHRVSSKTPPKAILELLEKCDAFRKPERFAKILLACEADCRGRPGYAQKNYVPAQILATAFAAAKNADLNTKSMSDLKGLEIKQKIFELRVKAIEGSLLQLR